MSLANGREYLAIPGPSVMPDRVLRAMHRAAPNIYEGAIVDEVAGIAADLKRVAKTESNLAIYIANGHGAWEAAMANTHSRGDLCLVRANGVGGDVLGAAGCRVGRGGGWLRAPAAGRWRG